MATLSLPDFAAGLPAARVDASLRQTLVACDRARQSAVLWFAEVQRRGLYRQLGHASLQLYATQALGFSDNRYYQFKRLADDLERLPVLRETLEAGAEAAACCAGGAVGSRHAGASCRRPADHHQPAGRRCPVGAVRGAGGEDT